MRISTVLCLCAFLLCCTGAAKRICKKLGVPAGGAAALSLLTAAGAAFQIPIMKQASANPGVILVIATACLLCLGRRGTVCTALLALACGMIAWMLQGAFPGFYEPGALLCLPAVIAGRFSLRCPRQGLLCVALTPLLFGLIVTAEDWYLFDVVVFSAGNALQFDMQLCGVVLYALLHHVPDLHRQSPRRVGEVV